VVWSDDSPSSIYAIVIPIYVYIPVANTIPLAFPFETKVLENTIFVF